TSVVLSADASTPSYLPRRKGEEKSGAVVDSRPTVVRWRRLRCRRSLIEKHSRRSAHPAKLESQDR
ncbi:MAG: hypothetical protein ACREA0_27640, partial [bacterium]